jgi:hypothetical protein
VLFRSAVIKLVSDVEEAYWRLCLAHHDLAAKIAERDRAYADWQRVRELQRSGLRGGEAEVEALARADFYTLQTEIQDAMFGTPSAPGVYEGSRRLTELMGMPPTPNKVLRPVETPPCCKFVFDWKSIYEEAVQQRPELREQRLMVRRREMQLVASRNTLWPTLDLVGEYNFQGYGQDLYGNGPQFASAMQTLGEGYYGSTLGLEATWLIGSRQARSAVRYSELLVCREKAVLQEQTRHIIHELAAIRGQMERAQLVVETTQLRLDATTQNLAAAEEAFRAQRVTFDVVVDARRRLADARTAHYRALIEHAVQLKNLQQVKGTLLAYHSVQLANASTEEAVPEAAGRFTPEPMVDYRLPEIDYGSIDASRRLPPPQSSEAK